MVIVYTEDKLNSIFNDPIFLSNYDIYKNDNIDSINVLKIFINDLEINKNYHKCSINKNKKYLSPESIKIKNINILLNKCNVKNIDDISKQIIDIISDNSNIIILVIDNILEKCISQIQYIELYINIILKLYKNVNIIY